MEKKEYPSTRVRKKRGNVQRGGEGQMTVTRPVLKTGTLKKHDFIHPGY